MVATESNQRIARQVGGAFGGRSLVARPGRLLSHAPPQGHHLSRTAALKLAQEVGKAFAHVTLAFLELKAGGWERDSQSS
jgi:hypothetical protein